MTEPIASNAADIAPLADPAPARAARPLGLLPGYGLSIGAYLAPRRCGRLWTRVALWQAAAIAVVNVLLLAPALAALARNPTFAGIVSFPHTFLAVAALGYFAVLFFVLLPFVPRPGSNAACLRHMTRSILLSTSLIWPFAGGYWLLHVAQARGALAYTPDRIAAYIGATALLVAWTTVALLRAVSVDYRAPRDMPTPPEPHCDDCGYDLRASPPNGVCPECGRPVAASLDPAARPGPAWEHDPRYRRVAVIAAQTRDLVLQPQRLFSRMPVLSGHDAVRRWLALNAVLVGCVAVLMLPAMNAVSGALDWALDYRAWPVYAGCLAMGVLWAFLGLMMVGVETLGLVVVARLHGHRLPLATASKVTGYASTLLIVWVLVGLVYFVGVTIGWDINVLHTGPLARWRDNLFVLSLGAAQILGLLWFELTVYRGLRRVQWANR